MDQWRPYPQHAEFDILTDQKSLIHLEQRLTTPWQQKAFTKLLGLRYRIRYKKGIENAGADALSRAKPSDTLFSTTSCNPAWLEDVTNSYHNNDQASRLLSQLAIREDPKGRFTLRQGIIYFRGRIWLGGSTHIQQRIISVFHDSPIGGHSGFPVTYRRIRRLFAWPKMKLQILQYVRCCQVCQQAKPDRAASPGSVTASTSSTTTMGYDFHGFHGWPSPVQQVQLFVGARRQMNQICLFPPSGSSIHVSFSGTTIHEPDLPDAWFTQSNRL